MTTPHRLRRFAAPLVFAGLLLAACGDDGGTTETQAQYLARMQTQCPSEDPGFDAFMGAHAEPTAADYVTFLPTPIGAIDRSISCVKGSKPPKDLKDKVDAVVKAMEVMRSDLAGALDDAKAGNLDGVNAKLGELNGSHIETLNAALAAVGVQQG